MNEAKDSRRLIQIGEAGRLLDLSRSMLYKYVEAGEIPHVRIGKRIRFEQGALEDWIRRHRKPEAAK